jgi:hypothetical protein
MATLLVNVDLGGGLLLNLNEPWVGAPPAAHAATHQNGGSDEINVAGLSGLLADDQNPVAHASDHENGGGDEINVGGLSGLLADAQTPLTHLHSSHTGLLVDDHTIYALLAGRAGGQNLIGGLNAGDALTLDASAHAGGGLVEVNHPIRSNYSEGNTTPAEQTGFGIWEPTFTTAGAFIGQMIRNDATITYTNSFYVYASVLDRSEHISNAAAGFQAFTLFNALPLIRNGTSNDIVQMLILNDGGTHERSTAGTSVAIQHLTVSAAPQIRALVAGAVATWSTGAGGITFAPKFSTAALSTVNMGTLWGVQMVAPAPGLFQPSAGVENITAIRGLWMRAHTTVVASDISVVYSEMTAAASRFFLNNPGGAQSDFGGGNLLDCGIIQILADNSSLSLGAAGGDVQINWNGSALEFDPLVGEDLRWSFAVGSHTLQSSNFGTSSELRMGFDRFAFGQTGAVGNQVGVFVAPTRATGVAGGWADFLLTQAGNLTIDHSMSDVSAWVINQISLTGGAGSITGYIATLNISGMTTSGIGSAETHAIRHGGRRTSRGVDAFEPLSPSALTGDVNNYAPATGGGMRQVWRLTTDDLGNRTVTGIAVQQGSDTQWITNVGTVDDIILAHQSGLSTASNRIISPTGANLTLNPNESALLWHDSVTDRWRVLYHTGA